MDTKEPFYGYDKNKQRDRVIKAGYKQTEVGVIPEDWEITTLNAICSVPMQNGVFYKPSNKGKGVKLVNVGDLYKTTPINVQNLELFDATEDEKKRFKVEDGDLFFTRSSIVPCGIAHCNVYKEIHLENMVFDSHVIRVRANFKIITPYFLYRFCISNIVRTYLISHSKTATMTTIDQGVLGECPVLLPSKTEQTAIAKALSDTDALIQSLRLLIVKKHQIKQGAMQQLLNPYDKGGELKTGWEEKILGSVLKIGHGRSQHEVVNSNGRYPILASGGEIGRAESFLYDKPSVLIGRKGTIDVPQYMDRPFWTIDTLFYSEILEPNNAKYIFYQFCLIDWYSYNEASGVPSLNAKTIENIEITIPPPEEQTQIAQILTDIDTEITTLESKLSKYQKIKQGMMQNLLTGRIRLI